MAAQYEQRMTSSGQPAMLEPQANQLRTHHQPPINIEIKLPAGLVRPALVGHHGTHPSLPPRSCILARRFLCTQAECKNLLGRAIQCKPKVLI